MQHCFMEDRKQNSFTLITLLNPWIIKGLILFQFYGGGNRESERFSDVPKDTELPNE